MAGRPSEAEQMTLGIISREGSCIECYRLLSAIYSKRGNYTEVCVCTVCVCCKDDKRHVGIIAFTPQPQTGGVVVTMVTVETR